MKLFFLTFALAAGPSLLVAQDKIILSTGEEYEVAIIDETFEYVEYSMLVDPSNGGLKME